MGRGWTTTLVVPWWQPLLELAITVEEGMRGVGVKVAAAKVQVLFVSKANAGVGGIDPE